MCSNFVLLTSILNLFFVIILNEVDIEKGIMGS